MDEKYVDQFVEDVFVTAEALKEKGVADTVKSALVASVQIVDSAHKKNGFPGLVRSFDQEDLERDLATKCIKGEGSDGPDIYLYTCYTEPDDPKSNTGGFTTHQLEEFAKVHHNLPVFLAHYRQLGPIGTTVGGGVNKEGALTGGLVFFDTPFGKLAHEMVEKMGVRGVSLGSSHKEQIVDGVPVLTHACLTEVSLCCLGDQKGTWIKHKLPWNQRSMGANARLISMQPSI